MIDLAVPLRAALIADAELVDLLATFKAEPAVFTRRPIPEDVLFPVVVVSPDIAVTDQDFVNGIVPVIVRDIAVYGRNDTAADYRVVEAAAYRVRDIFHRNRAAITASGWHVIDIVATGPVPAPTDDDRLTGRVVSLTIRLNPTA